MRMRPMTKADLDYFVGIPPKDGRPPLINSNITGNYLCIIDNDGIELTFDPEDGNHVYRLCCTYDLAKTVVEHLPEDFNIDLITALGFKEEQD